MKNYRTRHIVDLSNKLESRLKSFKRKGISAFKNLDEKEQKALFNWSKNVTRQYTKLIDNDLSNLKDIADLPYPKEDIKLAIKIMLPIYISNGPQSMIKKLKLAYQELATFQQIKKGDDKKIISPATSKNTDASITNRENLTSYNKYLDIAISKRKILFQEIDNYVEDLKHST
jgi:hypothetical protein